jgi:hypothetical protein
MPKIVISYRRSDSQAIAGRIRDRFVAEYGTDSVFMDIDSIDSGRPFIEEIKRRLQGSAILVPIIGPDWLGVGSDGQSRISSETDPVHIELATALDRDIPIIPVLVRHAVMPTREQLPETLRRLPEINAEEVDDGKDFHHHMHRLIRSVNNRVEESDTRRQRWYSVAKRLPYKYLFYFLVALLFFRLVFIEYHVRTGSLATIDEFVSCGARVLYPSSSFNEVDRLIDGEHIRLLVHAQKEAVARLYSSHTQEIDKIKDIIDKLAKGTTVSYRRVESEFVGILTGWRPSAVNPGSSEEYYFRLQSTFDNSRRYILYEMVHPPKDQSNHPYWNLNEIVSRTLLSKGSVVDIPKSCDFRHKFI